MKLTGAWIEADETQAICQMLEDAGFQALLVGGCVRNAFLDEPVNDVDIATDARPKTVSEIAAATGYKVVPTGIEHGTVTVIANRRPFEITTFRRDVQTDGRRAVVAFAEDVESDARRRDFTMNALYALRDGTVIDPLGGLPDLEARRVRFIEDPERRIREDYLRILRFFRFHAWYGNAEAGLDAEGLAAVASLADGIEALSRERVGAEMLKLLSAPDPAPSVAAMQQTGVLRHVLPGADSAALTILVHNEEKLDVPACGVRRLAAIGGQDVPDCLRLSRETARRLNLVRKAAYDTATAEELGYRHGVDVGTDIILLRASLLGEAVGPTQIEALNRGADHVFPVRAADLMPTYEGKALGRKLDELENHWIASGFALTREDLLL